MLPVCCGAGRDMLRVRYGPPLICYGNGFRDNASKSTMTSCGLYRMPRQHLPNFAFDDGGQIQRLPLALLQLLKQSLLI